MSRTRQVILIIIVAFLVYAVIKYPTRSAQVVHDIWDLIVAAFTSIFTFFNQLITG